MSQGSIQRQLSGSNNYHKIVKSTPYTLLDTNKELKITEEGSKEGDERRR